MGAGVDRLSDNVVVLLLPDKKELYPLSTHALRVAQSSKERLEIEYRNAFIIDQDGHLYQIKGFKFVNPVGDTYLSKFINKIFKLWNIQVSLLGPIDVSLEDLKKMMIYCIDFYAQDKFENISKDENRYKSVNDIKITLVNSIDSAYNKSDLLRRLDLPAASDCLDLL